MVLQREDSFARGKQGMRVGFFCVSFSPEWQRRSCHCPGLANSAFSPPLQIGILNEHGMFGNKRVKRHQRERVPRFFSFSPEARQKSLLKLALSSSRA